MSGRPPLSFVDVNDIPRQRREDILRLARRHGVTHVRVFGSVARHAATATSDLDLLVDLDSDRSVLDLIAFEQDLEEALHVPVDVLTEPALHPLLRQRVVAEAVPV